MTNRRETVLMKTWCVCVLVVAAFVNGLLARLAEVKATIV